MRVGRGRDFTGSDRADSSRVAIINETMARTLWPGENPIGKRIEDADPALAGWLEIVGVANDVESAIDFVRAPTTRFQVYIPLAQTQSIFAHWLNVAIRSDAPGPTLTAALRAAVLSIDPDQPISAVISAPDAIEELMRGFTMVAALLTVFSAIGLALSAVGIYGVIANLVAQRTSEIGIRMALGAQSRDVLWLVLGQGVRLSVAGCAIGLACAWGINQLLRSLVPAIPGGDPVALVAVALLLAAIALFACWLPARKATKVNPVIALRSE
jgi:putative ABC transport system permease protein